MTPRLILLFFFCAGSHNSGTYDLDPALGIAIDQESGIQKLEKCCCSKSVVHKWSRTQNLTLPQQLEAGIRYFDFRVSVHPRTHELRFVHGLYGDQVLPVLREIDVFLNENPREVVILDFSRFYGMTDEAHRILLYELRSIFNGKLFPVTNVGNQGATLENVWQTPYRVIVIYQNMDIVENQTDIWSTFEIVAPWANTNNVSGLIDFLDNQYAMDPGDRNGLFVWQGVVTPRPRDIVFGSFKSLETKMATKATEAFVKWLSNKEPGPRGVNICTADFVETNGFIETVVALNRNIQPVHHTHTLAM